MMFKCNHACDVALCGNTIKQFCLEFITGWSSSAINYISNTKSKGFSILSTSFNRTNLQ